MWRLLEKPWNMRRLNIPEYYRQHAELILTHVRGRSLHVKRFPHAMSQDYFFCHGTGELPSAARNSLPPGDEIVCESTGHILALMKDNCLTLVPENARKPDTPDWVVWQFTLTPKTPRALLIECLEDFTDVLREFSQNPVYMKTGDFDGVDVAMKLSGHLSARQAQDFAVQVARDLVKRHPNRLSRDEIVLREPLMSEKVYVFTDVNLYSHGICAPYCVVDPQESLVSMPLDPLHLERDLAEGVQFNIHDVAPRLEKYGDLWEDLSQ